MICGARALQGDLHLLYSSQERTQDDQKQRSSSAEIGFVLSGTPQTTISALATADAQAGLGSYLRRLDIPNGFAAAKAPMGGAMRNGFVFSNADLRQLPASKLE